MDGWELSGGTQWQSGAPLQPNTGGDLYAQFPSTVSNELNLGTNAIQLQPELTCDPRSHLASGQRFNPNCFTIPAAGTNGQYVWPYIKGPSYFNSDLAAFKNFKMGEIRNLQFRLSAFNFLNHALPEFNANGSASDLRLDFIGANNTASPTNTNTELTGRPAYEVGSRLMELAVKFNF